MAITIITMSQKGGPCSASLKSGGLYLPSGCPCAGSQPPSSRSSPSLLEAVGGDWVISVVIMFLC